MPQRDINHRFSSSQVTQGRGEVAPPRFSHWLPGVQEVSAHGSQYRFWACPRLGDIVQTVFPDFMRGDFDFETCAKVRPCLVVGVEEFASGRIIVRVAYGSSRVEDHQGVYGVRPGDLLIPSADRRTGLERDTKFCLRKVLELPFDTIHFRPFDLERFGAHPKRGSLDLAKPDYRRALESAVAEATRLGTALQEVDGAVHLRVDSRSGQRMR